MKKILFLLLIFLYTADLLAEEKYNFFGVELGEKLSNEDIIVGIHFWEEFFLPENFDKYYLEFHTFKLKRNEKKIVTHIFAHNLNAFLCETENLPKYTSIYKKKFTLIKEEKNEVYVGIENILSFEKGLTIKLECWKNDQFHISYYFE